MFGILKKRWQILNDESNHCNIQTCESIFNACCYLNNFMLDQMERSCVQVGRGAAMGNDGIWLDRATVLTEVTDFTLSLQFAKRCFLLAKHLCMLRKKDPIDVNAQSKIIELFKLDDKSQCTS